MGRAPPKHRKYRGFRMFHGTGESAGSRKDSVREPDSPRAGSISPRKATGPPSTENSTGLGGSKGDSQWVHQTTRCVAYD